MGEQTEAFLHPLVKPRNGLGTLLGSEDTAVDKAGKIPGIYPKDKELQSQTPKELQDKSICLVPITSHPCDHVAIVYMVILCLSNGESHLT